MSAQLALIFDDGRVTPLNTRVAELLGRLPADWTDYMDEHDVQFIYRVAVDLGLEGYDEKLERVIREAREAEERRQKYIQEVAERRLREELRRKEQRANWDQVFKESLLPIVEQFMAEARPGDVAPRQVVEHNLGLEAAAIESQERG